jgi:hypothetical protein
MDVKVGADLQRDLAKFERHVGSRTTVSLCCRQSGPF